MYAGTKTAWLFGNDYIWRPLVDPTDDSTGQVDAVSDDSGNEAGSYWPLVANLYETNQDEQIAFIPCAKGITSFEDWLPGIDHQDRSTLYGSMVYRILNSGEGRCKAILMHEGERDANLGTAEATINSQIDTIADALVVDLAGTGYTGLMLCKVHDIDTGDNTAVNNAIAAAWADNDNVLQGPDLSDLTTTPDGLHFTTNTHLSTIAGRWWTAMQAEWYS